MVGIGEKSCYNICVANVSDIFLSVSLKAVLWWRIIALTLRLGTNVSRKRKEQAIPSYKCSADTCPDLTCSLCCSCQWRFSRSVQASVGCGGSLHAGPIAGGTHCCEQQQTRACTQVLKSNDAASDLWRKGSLQSHPIRKLCGGDNRTPEHALSSPTCKLLLDLFTGSLKFVVYSWQVQEGWPPLAKHVLQCVCFVVVLRL